jgi:prefoldin subunit 5
VVERRAGRPSRRAAELKALRAELEQRLGQLDFRSESLDQAFAEIAQHAERTIRKLLTT